MTDIKELSEQSCTVHWAMPEPPIEATRWHKWETTLQLQGEELDLAIDWPQGTLHALKLAFQHNLSRSIGWDISALGDEARAALHIAASVFRRGVSEKNQGTVYKDATYSIVVHEQDPSLFWRDERKLIILDSRVQRLWNIPDRPTVLGLELNEHTKDLGTIARIRHWLKQQGTGVVSIIGGGILADTAAFAAALELRPFILIPTTLLAMLDACVGGKTGVNFPPFGKNQIGRFAFPEAVLVSLRWLESLSPRELRAGHAEGAKHAIIAGKPQLWPQDMPANISQVMELMKVKVEIIQQDPTEQNLRAVLNLGHTLAHALESCSHKFSPHDSILHGEAVGVGLLFIVEWSHKLGHLPLSIYQEMQDLLLKSGFLISKESLEIYLSHKLEDENLAKEILQQLKQDKKNVEATTEWVLLRDWGKFVQNGNRYTVPLSEAQFLSFWPEFLTRWKTLSQHGRPVA